MNDLENIEWDLKKIVTRWAEGFEIELNEQARRNFFVGPIEKWLAHLNSGGSVVLPVSPKYVDIEVVSSLPTTGSSGWGINITYGADIFSKEQIVNILSAKFAKRNNGADMLSKMSGAQLKEAGLTYEPLAVPMVDAFGYDHGRGRIGFNGNYKQFPDPGTRAVNPSDGKTYVFWSRMGGPGIVGYWVLPSIYDELTRF
jgi:hypothetical protein